MKINLKNPATQKWVIICTLTFGAIYGYVNFVYTPRRDAEIKLTADIKKESELLVKGKRIAANFQTVQDDYGRLMQSWEVAQDLLPTQKEMEGLLRNITEEGQKRDVNFLLFKPMDPVEKPYYWENPIQIRTVSKYHDLAEFLSSVAALDRIVNINGLKLENYKINRGHTSQTVVADFTASIYIFKGLGEPATTASEQADAAKAAKKKASAEGGEGGKPAKDKGAKA